MVTFQRRQFDRGRFHELRQHPLPHDLADAVKQRFARFGHDVADDDARGVERVADRHAAVAHVGADAPDEFLRACVTAPGEFEQRDAGLVVGERGRIGHDCAVFVEQVVDRDGRTVPFQAADIAAVAWLAMHVDAHMADFGGRAERAVDYGPVVDHAEADAFAEQIVGEVLVAWLWVEEVLGQGAGTCILLDDHRDAERVLEFGFEIDFAPLPHRRDDRSMANAAQVGPGHGHADRHDVGELPHDRADELLHRFNRLGWSGVIGRLVHPDGLCAAGQVEQADLDEAACEFDAEHTVLPGIDCQSD